MNQNIIMVFGKKILNFLRKKKLPWFFRYETLSRKYFKALWKIRQPRIRGHFQKIKHKKYNRSFKIAHHRRRKNQNLILLVLDTARAQDMPMYGGKAKMPFLQNLLGDCTLYRNAYSNSEWTISSHASLFTGTYPGNHGVVDVDDSLSNSLYSIADVLKAQDYETICITDNALVNRENNLSKGFMAYEYTNAYFGGAESRPKKFKNVFTSNKPFFLFMNLMTNHRPYSINPVFFDEVDRGKAVKTILELESLPLSFEELQNRLGVDDLQAVRHLCERAYISSLQYLDYQLSQIFYYLQSCDSVDDAMIIITSDHGEEILNHRVFNYTDKPPWSKLEGKYVMEHCSLYDSTIKIPLIIRHKKDQKRIVDEYASIIDIFPTILDELGIHNGEQCDQLQGRSLLGAAQDAFVFAEGSRVNSSAFISGEYKLISHNNRGHELYNIKKDPEEHIDISEQSHETAENMLGEIKKHRQNKDSKYASKKIREEDEDKLIERLKGLGYL